MKKILLALFLFCVAVPAFAQSTSGTTSTRKFGFSLIPESFDTLGNQGDIFYIDSADHNYVTRDAIGASGAYLYSNGIVPSWRVADEQVRLAADTSTTGQTLVGSPLQFAVGANQTWQFQISVYDSSSSAAGDEFGWLLPSSGTVVSLGIGQANATAATAAIFDIITASATAGTASNTAGGYSLYTASGTVTTGATAGNVVFEFLKVTSGKAILKAGSVLVARRIS